MGNLPLKFWIFSFCLGIMGCALNNKVVEEDKEGNKHHQVTRVVPQEENYHPYGRRSYWQSGVYYSVLDNHRGYDKVGKASWYGQKFHGRQTATQEIFDIYKMTAASPELPLPCYVEVTNLSNGKKVIVRVNDRGPFVKGRILDLSYGAAVHLGFADLGVTEVRIRGIDAFAWHKQQRDKGVRKVIAHSSSPTEAEAVREVVVPKEVKIERAIIESVKAKPEWTKVRIQVAAFSKAENADRFLSQLLRDFPLPKVAVEKEGEVFRVVCGPFENELLLESFKQHLAKHNFPFVERS